MKGFVKTSQARKLLHNKFVVILGGSVQRSMYKDLVRLLQTDSYLTLSQLKSKGEHSFESDSLMEGGRMGPMTNGTDYTEVRQYNSGHHLLRFYFITRVFSPYMETILEDLRTGLKPDLIIVSSCVWDITRYGLKPLEQYKENLHKFFGQIKTVVCHDCLIIWTLAMPLAKQIKGGFLVPEVSHLGPSLCTDIIEANFFGGRLADAYGLDILDMHFHFRLSLQHRMPDGVHWDALAHRRISSLLMEHVAQAWGVSLEEDSTTTAATAPLTAVTAAPVLKKKKPKKRNKPKWFPPPPPPPLMCAASRHRPWCLSHSSPFNRPPGMNFHRPMQHFPGPDFAVPEFPMPPPQWRMPPPHWCPDWRPGWGPVADMWPPGGGCVRWRRPNHRAHPYPPSGPRQPMWGW